MNQYKTPDEIKRVLKQEYEHVVKSYTVELNNMWGLEPFYCWWVNNEIGGTYCFNDTEALNFDEIIFCVENNVDYKTFSEWSEYCIFANEFNQNIPNLQAWYKGCPRLSAAEQQKLKDIKSDLYAAINDYKKRF